MSPITLARSVGYLIRRSQQVHNLIWSEELGGELTSPQYAALAVIAAHPSIDQRRVGALASLDKSSVAEIAARLSDKSWITRERDDSNRRRNVLNLTPAAALALEYLTPRAARVQERLLAPLDLKGRERMQSNLERLVRVEDAPAEASAFVLNLTAPGHLIRRAQQVQTAIWTDRFGGDLTGPQFAALHVAVTSPSATQRELGERAALDKSTAAEVLRRLEAKSWVVRERDPADRRGKVVLATDTGRESYARFTPWVVAVQNDLLGPLDPAAHELFLDDLGQVAFAGAGSS